MEVTISRMFPYDHALLDLVRTTPQSVADVLRIMRKIDAVSVVGDGLKWFNGLYLQVTEVVESRVVAGGFADLDWLAELDVQFARLYFAALASSLTGQPAPGSWRVLFERRNQTAIARIQFALAGINAHINHDLPLALVATCEATATTPEHGGVHYRDYTALNATLDGLVETAKTTLHVRLLGDALPAVSHLEDTIAAWGVSAAREKAWQNAGILWHVRAWPALSSTHLDTIDGLTTVVGKALLVPVP